MSDSHVSLDSLTVRQREVLDFIRDKIEGRGYGPTVREIGESFQIASPNGVMCHLKALEKKGLITREPNRSRAIQLAPEAMSDTGMPLVGSIAAGNLTEAIEEAERFHFDDWFPVKKNHFALRVKGDSMIEAAIADGDIVICRKTKTAHKGDIVAAVTDEGEATLKYWYPETNRIRLQPANSTMKPIFCRQVEVLGVVTGVVRRI
ncbi:transcriptional repressor LexA [Botrimarina hoheduenensis]|uniref:LexA repressor n=1 Tax=Botrimarina hoheduenensis TaxID=2528000 RepID=A0A5C5VZ07_9BACT|nr:transcriptional repressor LexA [Botrimarina hoheduenensis]TWT43275.1 LexA repressor [Botrimarina hoheduenensis]